jgi:hypothetical protein
MAERFEPPAARAEAAESARHSRLVDESDKAKVALESQDAPVAQWIEQRFPEPHVRFMPEPPPTRDAE